MQRLDGRFVYSASDLNDYLECRRLTELESLVARGALVRPDDQDEQARLLRLKGEAHEIAHLEQLRELYRNDVVEFGRSENSIEGYRRAEAETLDAMRRGASVIYQATFFDGTFIGRGDFLRRVAIPSDLGDYSYEVMDTKLGLNPKPYYIIQLCNYSEHVERLQGRLPHAAHVLLGNGVEQSFRLNDYMAYYRRLKRRFMEFAGASEAADRATIYPLQRSHCKLCAWNRECESQRRRDDHLSLVARIRRDQIARFEEVGITDVAALGNAGDDARPSGMNASTFAALRRQAKLQVRGRAEHRPLYELLQPDPGLGFELLAQPARGDVFFDMEGDPLFEPGRSLEYLFGCWLPDDSPPFRAFWAHDRNAEKRAFEDFVDFVTARRKQYPSLHIYHYANYEKEALRRLAQRHSTREAEVDGLLRGEVLVDLFAVVRRAIVVSEESYSIKNLERFYGFERATELKKGDRSIVMFEQWMTDRNDAILEEIERYNRDDCLSTYLLREWLLKLRVEAMEEFGVELPLRSPRAPGTACHIEFVESCKRCVKRRAEDLEETRRTDLERRLLSNVIAPLTEEEYRQMAVAGRTRYLLAHLLAYHRREEKPGWWTFFDRCENSDELLEFDRDSIGDLRLLDRPPRSEKKSTIYTYEFPDQLYKLAAGDEAVDPRTQRAGTIVSLDADANRLEFKTTATAQEARAITELIPMGPRRSTEQRKALARIATSFLAGSLHEEYPATHDLLVNGDPRLRRPGKRVQPNEVHAESVSELVAALEQSYLFIQGPPGSGKSTIASHVICDLLLAGKRIAVTSTSHKAIHNLLGKVEVCVAMRGGSFRGLYKHSSSESEYVSKLETPLVESVSTNEAFVGDDYQLAGGTGWLCAREPLHGKFDYLFIDEAGQVSLADALAMSLCAKNVVVLGDPAQLGQVSQGRHPIHADDSILEHLLGDAETVPEHRGVFLDLSYRMQPAICDFVSDAMYEGRLKPAPQTQFHCVETPGREYAGLYFVGVPHQDNGSRSLEECGEIVRLISVMLDDATLVDSNPPNSTIRRKITARDLIVVTPYNAQRRLIVESLRNAGVDVDPATGVRVGTVDKFQGQEAAVVFYSMATSSGEDIPRNVEFLFERNRFNVAISRARAASILICSPRLLDIRCRTPQQMALANLLCAFEERAQNLYAANAAALS